MSDHTMERWRISGQSGIACKDCGAAKNSGYWFLSGYKSKIEPMCHFKNFDSWKKEATEVELV